MHLIAGDGVLVFEAFLGWWTWSDILGTVEEMCQNNRHISIHSSNNLPNWVFKFLSYLVVEHLKNF